MSIIGYGVEGITDAPVAEHLIRHIGREPRVLSDSGGCSVLDAKILRWNAPSLTTPILVLRDWDERDGVECVPALLTKLLGGELATPGLVVRIPVRSIEAWLLADNEAFKSYFHLNKLPAEPDQESSPKRALVSACRKSKSAEIRKAMVPTEQSGRAVGKLYEPTLVDFAVNYWNPTRAAKNSPSLRRALVRLQMLVQEGKI
jgi:Domain of unknown function (DUF4276)